ncbi:MAG: DoxX family protein [Bacteroidota bacterium]|nr:DoxX family protein [Bacteroidota bacterium]
MKKIFSVNQASNGAQIGLLFIRVAIGVLMLTHGLPKMQMLLSGDPVQFPPLFGLTPATSLGLAVFAEVFCAVLVIVGLGTRLAVIPLIVTMLVAVFMIHAADPFSQKEMATIYLVAFFGLLLTGSGKFSLDYLLQPQRVSKQR